MVCTQVTIARVWAALSAWQKAKFVVTLVHSGLFMPDNEELRKMVEDMKEADVLTEVRACLCKQQSCARAYVLLVTALASQQCLSPICLT